MPREAIYQARLIKKIQKMFPTCFVLKNDPSENQGIPDILILFNGFWAMLETKISADAPQQPNQQYYVDKFGEMAFASFIYPENENEVLVDLMYALDQYMTVERV